MTDTTWRTLDVINAADPLMVARAEHLASVAKDEAYDRLMAAQLAWRTGYLRQKALKHDDYGYAQAAEEFARLDDELQAAKETYRAYCPHNHPIPFQVGNYHFGDGDPWDDIRDTTICADCGMELS